MTYSFSSTKFCFCLRYDQIDRSTDILHENLLQPPLDLSQIIFQQNVMHGITILMNFQPKLPITSSKTIHLKII